MSWTSNELAASQRYKEHKAALARIAKLEAALREIIDMPGEINLCNYHPDDVRKLNNAFIDCYHIASKALEES